MPNANFEAWQQAQQAMQELLPKQRAILDRYNQGELTEAELHQQAGPLAIAMLQNYEVQADCAEAAVADLGEANAKLLGQLALYEKFVKKMGLAYKFDDYCNRGVIKKVKKLFHRT